MTHTSRYWSRYEPSRGGGDSNPPKARGWYRRVYSDHVLDALPATARRCGQPNTAVSTAVEVVLARSALQRARAAARHARRRYLAGEDGAAAAHVAEARAEQARRALQRAEAEARGAVAGDTE